ncbi:alpha-L-rhamnosidase C-terminal domain-containing protein [Bifidobacterium sp. ESL0764]|uniref:alpha-L-rhamnosidase C-terminal domain-containing protein n=1 Tax=Bifidobacterium sp. ESL0764 TaxID=2983228 RepID=UPI0023F9436C|nr:alpha-L-rhamnosidase C-terminal domain-containing protein [Bifidobacterium sp. ESL0764]WEV66009.1 hypothetical protein OZX71_01220 [Bifidobacterium sp. ESL0764]
MMYFGNRVLLRRNMRVVDRILGFFHKNLDENGLVARIGNMGTDGSHWSFVDWAPEWDSTRGVPPAFASGPLTQESLMYVWGLQLASRIDDYLGIDDKARQYRQWAKDTQRAVNAHCVNASGLYTDGPGSSDVSQHCQVFAALTDTCDVERARKCLETTLDFPHRYAQCSVAMSLYLFEALEKVGLYSRTKRLWKPWKDMLANHLTTCAESNDEPRSDCHGWSALALHEFPSAILGVKPGAPGFRTVLIAPHWLGLNDASGSVATNMGLVHVSWSIRVEGRTKVADVRCVVPRGMKVIFRQPGDPEVQKTVFRYQYSDSGRLPLGD